MQISSHVVYNRSVFPQSELWPQNDHLEDSKQEGTPTTSRPQKQETSTVSCNHMPKCSDSLNVIMV